MPPSLPLHVPAPRKVRFWSELSGTERQQWLEEAEALRFVQGDLLLRNGDADPALPYAHILLLPRPDLLAEGPVQSYRSRQQLALGAPEDPFLKHLLPLIPGATRIEVVAAFVQPRGLQLLSEHLHEALEHGAQVQIVTGDYLGITSADALQILWDWQQQQTGLRVRVMENARLQRAFHPKAWRIHRPEGGIAYVGSSNISHSALLDGVEWNLRLEAAGQPDAWHRLGEGIAQTWKEASPLEAAWIAAYRRRVRPAALPTGLAESPEPPPEPRDVQREALAALQQARTEGKQRVLVVLATGLGKTLLAAFDVARFLPRRCLVLAHRAELLEQAAHSFRRLLPEATFSWMIGPSADIDGDIVFASVQKLYRMVASLPDDHFDYILVDEVHHAMAQSYRHILGHFRGAFVLGLTATPERADQRDLRTLFDGGIVFRADLGVGIQAGALVPFHYRGIRDTVNYQPLPWRNGRFDLSALEQAVQTQARMEKLWEEWEKGGASRSLLFCCSLSHARFVQRWLREKGLRVALLHGGMTPEERQKDLLALESGRLDAICSVELLNEGVDLPRVDRVVMLRPTESSVIFLQQLGRGLRAAPGKERLQVLDFVGNHRIFPQRLGLLLQSSGTNAALSFFLSSDPPYRLPLGCQVDFSLEVKELLLGLLPKDPLCVWAWRCLAKSYGRRPTALELWQRGYEPRQRPEGWFGLCTSEGCNFEAWEEGREWLLALERASASELVALASNARFWEQKIGKTAAPKGEGLEELARELWQFRQAQLLEEEAPSSAMDLQFREGVLSGPVPDGPVQARRFDGVRWRFFFRDGRCREAAPVGEAGRPLPTKMWPERLRLFPSPDGWWIGPNDPTPGTGSRELPEIWKEAAKRLVSHLKPGWLEGRGRRCRVDGVAAQGGVRISGGEGGFGERTVSLVDLGWVLAAREDARQEGGLLDERRVNRLRYREDTQKGGTRWIDTGWALVIADAEASGG